MNLLSIHLGHPCSYKPGEKALALMSRSELSTQHPFVAGIEDAMAEILEAIETRAQV